MGTRSVVGFSRDKVVYVHYDGYPENMMEALSGFIKNHGLQYLKDTVHKASEEGYIRCVDKEGISISYQNGENGYWDLDKDVLQQMSWVEYAYIINPQTGKLSIFGSDNLNYKLPCEQYKEFLADNFKEIYIGLTLVETGEIHSNGWPIYRPAGVEKTSNQYGRTGLYFMYDGDEMARCGEPYKDEFGTFDGEPVYTIDSHNYLIQKA